MGWRQIGDNEEQLGQKRCRSLDNLVDGAHALQNALRKGLTLDGIEGEEFSWKEVWCPELVWTSSDAISNVKDAYNTLKRLNEIEEVMDALSTSLKDAIETVSDLVVRDSRETGLSRLPDDVLAQIFEICHLQETISFTENPPSFPQIISSVCKHFHRIAVHLPLLWRYTSPKLTGHSLSVYKSRCQHPSVDLNVNNDNFDSSEEFLSRVHPHDQWEEFRLHYSDIKLGHKFFQMFGPRVQTPLTSLRRLSIESNGVDLEMESQIDNVDDDGEIIIRRTILEADEATLASWRCPNLIHLKLANITPSIVFPCLNVTEFIFELKPAVADIHEWDLHLIRDFLQSMPNLELILLNFEGNMDFLNIDDVEPLTLQHLTTLRLFVTSFTCSNHVGTFLDILDPDSLTTLLIYVELDERKRREVWRPTMFGIYDDDREDIGGWMWNVFGQIRVDEELSRNCRDRTRPFPNVVDFSLTIETVGYVIHPLFNPMFQALPNVQDLKLALPENIDIDLLKWMEMYGGLRELRTMCVQDLRSDSPAKYLDFFREFSEMEQWDTFEELQIVRHSEAAFCTEDLEECVGEKLVWMES